MIEEKAVFPNLSSGVIVTPSTYVKEQVNRSSPPALTKSPPLSVVTLVKSEEIQMTVQY